MSMVKKILVIGQGAIAKRLVSHLQQEKAQVFVYRHKLGVKGQLEGLAGIVGVDDLDVPVDAVVIASPSATHSQYIEYFVGKLPIFIEKPVFTELNTQIETTIKKIEQSSFLVMAGFQMRFVPIIKKITQMIKDKQLGSLLHASVYAGQYLPFWRPNQDYRKSYSASFERGGGAALDLIHEIDLACEWFAINDNLSVRSERLGTLSIDTENFVQLDTTTPPFIRIVLDSLNHTKTRTYAIIGDSGSLYCDLYQNDFEYTDREGKKEIITDPKFFDVSMAYNDEIKYFLSHLGQRHPEPLERWLGIDALAIALKARKHYG